MSVSLEQIIIGLTILATSLSTYVANLETQEIKLGGVLSVVPLSAERKVYNAELNKIIAKNPPYEKMREWQTEVNAVLALCGNKTIFENVTNKNLVEKFSKLIETGNCKQ